MNKHFAQREPLPSPTGGVRWATEIMRREGGPAYHAKVEATRPCVPEFVTRFREVMALHAKDLRVAGISPSLIEDKAAPIKAALQGLSDVTQLLPQGGANTTPLKPLL